jgi:hypothetical protein
MNTSANGATTTGTASPVPVGLRAILQGHPHDWIDGTDIPDPPCAACEFYDDPLYRAALLRLLLAELAAIRYEETTAYAAAFLAAAGTEQAKTQAAKQATAGLHQQTELAAANVATCQLLLKGVSES